MIKVRWYWIDGTFDEFTVESMKHAEDMANKLYRNTDIVSVEISEQA